MVLAIVIAFAVSMILHSLVSTQNLSLQINAEVSKIMKNVQCNLSFVFIELSETANTFVKKRLLKNRFHRKRGFMKMLKHEEIFDANKGYKLELSLLYQLCRLENRNLWCTCQSLFDQALHTPTFYMKINHFNIAFHMA